MVIGPGAAARARPRRRAAARPDTRLRPLVEEPRSSRAPRRSRRSSCWPRAFRPRATGRAPTARRRCRAVDELGGTVRRQGRWARGGQGRRGLPRSRLGRRRPSTRASWAVPFGDAGRVVVVEELLVGDEVSLLALCHGQTARPLARTGLQARRRRRRGNQYGRHGRLLAGAVVRRRGDGPTRAPRARAAARRARAAWHPVLGLSLRRADADGRRAARAGVQRALRRPGDPGPGRALRRRSRGRASRQSPHGAPDEVALGVGGDAAVTLVLAAPGYPEATRTGPGDPPASNAPRRCPALASSTRARRCATAGWWSLSGRVLGVTATAPTLPPRARARAGRSARDRIRRQARPQRHRAAGGRGGSTCLNFRNLRRSTSPTSRAPTPTRPRWTDLDTRPRGPPLRSSGS